MALLATCSGRRQNSSAASPFPNQNRKRKWCRPNRQQHVTGKRIDGSFPPYFPANNKYYSVTNKWQGISLIFLTATVYQLLSWVQTTWVEDLWVFVDPFQKNSTVTDTPTTVLSTIASGSHSVCWLCFASMPTFAPPYFRLFYKTPCCILSIQKNLIPYPNILVPMIAYWAVKLSQLCP